MTPEQQRIAIAEFCGWTNICLQPLWVSDIEDEFPPVLCGTHPSKGRPEGIPKRFGPLPDYLNDLNAMHDAWLTLSLSEKEQFESELYSIVIGGAEYNRNDDAGWITNATAAQRAESFLKTLNLWKP